MSKKLYPESDIQNIANAIRTLNGSSDTYTIGQMANAITLPENAYYLKSISGNPLSLTDGEDNLKTQQCEVSFSPIQDLHGYEYPWVGGAGKNKVNAEIKGQTTVSGITGECFADNRFVLSGTSTGNGDFVTNCTPFTIPSGTTYTISIHGDLTLSSNAMFLYYGGKNTNFTASAKARTVTATEDITISNLRFRCFTAVTVSADFKLQIEFNSTAIPYEPYENICPISGRDSVKLDRTGVNQWDEVAEKGTINDTTGENANSGLNQYTRSKNYIRVLEGATYCFKVASTGKVYYYDAEKTYMSYSAISVGAVKTIPSGCAYIRFWVNYSGAYNHDMSVNYPSTITDYVPYQVETHTHTYESPVIGGVDDFASGEGKRDTTLLNFTSSDYWAYNASLKGFRKTFSISELGFDVALMSNLAKVEPSSVVDANFHISYSKSGNNFYLDFVNTDTLGITTADSWKALLTSKGGASVAIKRTITTPITNTPTDIELLKGDNVMWSDSNGDITVKYFSKSLT